jgi:hypothetical protein
MATAKQKAAARRNIKKARAALKRKSRKKGKICLRTVRQVAEYARRHGYKVVKK